MCVLSLFSAVNAGLCRKNKLFLRLGEFFLPGRVVVHFGFVPFLPELPLTILNNTKFNSLATKLMKYTAQPRLSPKSSRI